MELLFVCNGHMSGLFRMFSMMQLVRYSEQTSGLRRAFDGHGAALASLRDCRAAFRTTFVDQ
jgi:hypothetical protein